jgi:hypothetical protein
MRLRARGAGTVCSGSVPLAAEAGPVTKSGGRTMGGSLLCQLVESLEEKPHRKTQLRGGQVRGSAQHQRRKTTGAQRSKPQRAPGHRRSPWPPPRRAGPHHSLPTSGPCPSDGSARPSLGCQLGSAQATSCHSRCFRICAGGSCILSQSRWVPHIVGRWVVDE